MAELTPEEALTLCERALQIDIARGEAERLWPCKPSDPELAEVREDLLFGLEHVPISDAHPHGDPARWRRMPEYDDITRHVHRLRERLTA